jgi:hypothetical protein
MDIEDIANAELRTKLNNLLKRKKFCSNRELAAGLELQMKKLSIQKNKEKKTQLNNNKELAFQNDEEKRAAELVVANKELAFQNDQKNALNYC